MIRLAFRFEVFRRAFLAVLALCGLATPHGWSEPPPGSPFVAEVALRDSAQSISADCYDRGFRKRTLLVCVPEELSRTKSSEEVRGKKRKIKSRPKRHSLGSRANGIVLADGPEANCGEGRKILHQVGIEFHRSISPNRLNGIVATALAQQIPWADRRHEEHKGVLQEQIWNFDFGRNKVGHSGARKTHACLGTYGDPYCACFANMSARLAEVILQDEGRKEVTLRPELFSASTTAIRAQGKAKKWYQPYTQKFRSLLKKGEADIPAGCFVVLKRRGAGTGAGEAVRAPGSDKVSYPHVAIALGVGQGFKLDTVEGNTDCGREEGICRRTRPLDYIADKKLKAGDPSAIDGFVCPFEEPQGSEETLQAVLEGFKDGTVPAECQQDTLPFASGCGELPDET